MPKSFRGLYAVLMAVVLSAPAASASSISTNPTAPRSWSFADTFSDLLVRLFAPSAGGPEAGPAGVGSGEGSRDGATPPADGDDGPHADPAG